MPAPVDDAVRRAADAPPRDALFALARAVLFELDPERAHDLALALLERPAFRRLVARGADAARGRPLRRMGIDFANPVGLAAGLDKDARHVDALGALGFGAIEVGTVTPRPQPGNPRPRLFRLPLERALINRMGFNNDGVDALARRVERRRWPGPLGINIGKNAATPIERAADDYLRCLERVHGLADWVTLNVSSPNTAQLRELQRGESLARLLDALGDARERLATRDGRRVPLALKIAPDLDDAALDGLCAAVVERGVDAIVCGNTTAARPPAVARHLHAGETGGLSGAPLGPLADERLAAVAARTEGSGVTLIGVGGILCGADAARKLALGADLVQLYTGLIFHGPALVHDCIERTRGTTGNGTCER